MTFEWVAVLRDVLVVGYLFVLRIGVPIALTWLLGMWLQKALRDADAAALRQAERDRELVRTHCWEIVNCPAAVRANCAAARHPELPCWLALQIDGGGLKQACYTCPLYVTGPSVPRVIPVAATQSLRHASPRRSS